MKKENCNCKNQDFGKTVKKEQACNCRKDNVAYSYYSRLLQKPFDSVEELKEAEASYLAEQKAKEDKATAKKADAMQVEEAFKALNTTRKLYKEGIIKLTEKYSSDLKLLKEAFDSDKKELKDIMAAAEDTYSAALKAFTDKYPEGYHITLKDGDFETTISKSCGSEKETYNKMFKPFDDLFLNFFGFGI